ncbi:MAG: lysine--tRNA ligase [Cytophagales bacterium]|nr:lysine--tRNA ligase [Cytophagales bacterium]
MHLSEQEIFRRNSLTQLISDGINPYPSATFETNTTAEYILSHYTSGAEDFEHVSIAGRLMTRRIMGNASFAVLQDHTGKIQFYVRRDDICPTEDKNYYNNTFKKNFDIGDIIGIKGYVFSTQTGETTIHVREITMLAKALKPLPIVKETTDEQGHVTSHDAFTHPELRYRQRYVDLIVNPHVKTIFAQRAKLIQTMRNFFIEKNYLEVETPVLQPIYGGAAARPFTTHHNTLDTTLYLRISNELYLKRLIVGGFEGVFEFAKDFRNEGMSRFHNPEFTLLEIYIAYKDYQWMMQFTETLIEKVAIALHGNTAVQVGEHTIDFKAPWKRYTMYEAIAHYTGIDISQMNEEQLRHTCQKLNINTENSMGKGKLIDEIFGAKCEPLLIQPTFITDYPVEMSPLAKKHREKAGLVERFEVICNGKEICNAFTELNDPIDQRERFEAQLELGKRGDDEAMMLDEDYLRALEYGMPPTAGLGIGIDRLTMIMTNSHTIQEVLLFPQMRPENF